MITAAAHVFVADLDEPVLSGADMHHLQRALRLRSGEEVTASDGQGGWRPCRWASSPSLRIAGPVQLAPRPEPLIAVGLAPGKGDRPEWAVQKLTELGVDRIVLFSSDRSVVRWSGDRAAAHIERLRRVARGASMQSRRVWLGVVEGPATFPELSGRPAAAMAAMDGGPLSLAHSLVLVGPEGGWSDAELGVGLPRLGLGPLVLRSETAAVTVGALLSGLRAGLVAPA